MSGFRILASVFFLLLALSAVAESEVSPFLESGAFIGGEKDAPLYSESAWRLRLETGYDFRFLGKQRWGLGISMQPAQDDFRLSLLARWNHSLSDPWSIHAGAGILYSSESEESGVFDTGWEARIGFRHRRHVSINLLYQELPFDTGADPVLGYHGPRNGTHRAIYGGLMFHDKPGAWLGAGMLAGFGVLMIIALRLGV